MWLSKSSDKKDGAGNGSVAVAVNRDKSSQQALKWAADHLVTKGQSIFLIHVNPKPPSSRSAQAEGRTTMSDGTEVTISSRRALDSNDQTRKKRKPLSSNLILSSESNALSQIQCQDITLEATDIAKAITEFVAHSSIANLVVGASSKGGFFKSNNNKQFVHRRFRNTDVANSVSKGAPDFCTVYIISKGKMSSLRSASRPAPALPPFMTKIPDHEPPLSRDTSTRDTKPETRKVLENLDSIKSPFARGGGMNGKVYTDFSLPETDISFVSSSGRPSTDQMFPSFYDHLDTDRNSRYSTSSGTPSYEGYSFDSMQSARKSIGFSMASQESGFSHSSQNNDDVDNEMRRLKLELKQTMDMYSTACKEALTAQQKATELHRWKMEEQQRLEDARRAEEAARVLAEREKAKCKAAMEAAQASQRVAELEARKRVSAEMKALEEAQEKKKMFETFSKSDIRYRKYTIEEIEVATDHFNEARKIGEGGYGPVFKGHLDHTQVAIKILRPDAAQGRSQFQQEYMANGSLDDCLFRKGNRPPLSWQLRFRISADIATGLLFLHQTKPEPIVHRDLKPGNILLDRNYVSKIADVGLARLVPPSVNDCVTQYRITSTAGTFCYIDPEYQQTGMLGIKSDIYSLGIMLLQIITAKPPMGLTHRVEQSIEKETFADMLDPAVTDWPMEEALSYANLAIKCAELRRKDRPDLAKVILPELERLRSLADDCMPNMIPGSANASPNNSYIATNQEVMSDPHLISSGFDSSISNSSLPEKQSRSEA
ncbi:hypothetical protein C5167_035116 [Papaver somniferum]|uniref:RING-type E3 ubiquitin transferase n=1 Tax=Papaver somniferum TaxID=3469 RepID=A0A4Y7KGI7_PAPSO|nr:hypothetical protein C5167_035116 [Papaver somniferum]